MVTGYGEQVISKLVLKAFLEARLQACKTRFSFFGIISRCALGHQRKAGTIMVVIKQAFKPLLSNSRCNTELKPKHQQAGEAICFFIANKRNADAHAYFFGFLK